MSLFQRYRKGLLMVDKCLVFRCIYYFDSQWPAPFKGAFDCKIRYFVCILKILKFQGIAWSNRCQAITICPVDQKEIRGSIKTRLRNPSFIYLVCFGTEATTIRSGCGSFLTFNQSFLPCHLPTRPFLDFFMVIRLMPCIGGTHLFRLGAF